MIRKVSFLISILILFSITFCSHAGIKLENKWEGIQNKILQVHVIKVVPYNFSKRDIIEKMENILFKAAKRRAISILDNYVIMNKPSITTMQYNSLRLFIYNSINLAKRVDSFCHFEYCEAIYSFNIKNFLENF